MRVTIQLSIKEEQFVRQVAEEMDLSYEAVLRRALRYYQGIELRLSEDPNLRRLLFPSGPGCGDLE